MTFCQLSWLLTAPLGKDCQQGLYVMCDAMQCMCTSFTWLPHIAPHHICALGDYLSVPIKASCCSSSVMLEAQISAGILPHLGRVLGGRHFLTHFFQVPNPLGSDILGSWGTWLAATLIRNLSCVHPTFRSIILRSNTFIPTNMIFWTAHHSKFQPASTLYSAAIQSGRWGEWVIRRICQAVSEPKSYHHILLSICSAYLSTASYLVWIYISRAALGVEYPSRPPVTTFHASSSRRMFYCGQL